jgi:hypothetical protein
VPGDQRHRTRNVATGNALVQRRRQTVKPRPAEADFFGFRDRQGFGHRDGPSRCGRQYRRKPGGIKACPATQLGSRKLVKPTGLRLAYPATATPRITTLQRPVVTTAKINVSEE